jgi:uncharacterized membrane protein HdeD (DUF308 family)
MRKPVGLGGMFLMLAGIALTVAAFRDKSPDSIFAPFRWFGPVLLGAGLLMLFLIWAVIRD